ncbi:MAG: PilZ domain-containing protein [Nitrospirota bacterium]
MIREKRKENGMSSSKEKRRHKRLELPLLVLKIKGRHLDQVFFGYAQNISRDGLFVSSSNKFRIGERFPIEFLLPDNKTKVRCTCEVIWKKDYNNSKNIQPKGIGIKFVDLDNKKKEMIYRGLMNTNNKEDEKRILKKED